MPPSPIARSIAAWTARCLPCVVAISLGVYAYRVLLLAQPPFHADEAGHALPAARMALALGQGDVAGFLDLTRQDLLWPFFHPLFIALFFLAFGTTASVARASSLCAFAATIGLLPLLVQELARPRPAGDSEPPSPVLGWLSAAALVAAPALWGFSCLVMTESLGMVMIVGTLIVSARAERGQRVALHAASGVLAALVFLTKYNYGVPLLVAVFVALAWRTRGRGPRPLAAFCAGAVPPLLAWAGWVFGTDRARMAYLWDYIRVNRDEGIHGLESVLFYPRSILEVLGVAVGIGLLLGALAAFRRRSSGARLTSLLFVSLTLALLLPHPNKQWRYLAPAMPVLLALAEAELGAWSARVRRRDLVWGLTAGLLVLARDPLEGIREAAREEAESAQAGAMLRFAALHLPRDRPVLVLGSCGRLPHMALTWELLERDGREPDVEVMLFPDEDRWDERYRSGYPTGMRAGYATFLDARLAGTSATVVAFELGARSPFLPDWMARWDAWAQNYVTVMKAQAGYALAAEKAFPDSDAAVRVYVRTPP